MLEQLLEIMSVSGHEEEIADTIETLMAGTVDEVRRDEMNNTVCIINPQSEKRILLSAHVDEIGLIISHITKEGFLKAVNRGGIILKTYLGHQVKIQGKMGPVYGVVTATKELSAKTDLKETELTIDIGANGSENARGLVELGSPIVFDSHIRSLANGRICARALDDRAGVAVILEAVRKARERGCRAGVYAAATVGEETTKSGAYWTSARIKPTEALIVDVTYTSDYPGADAAETGEVILGGGAVLCHSPMCAKRMNKKLADCAKNKHIPIQWEVASRLTCTDADKIHFANEGIPVALVSIPLRYMHTPGEVAQKSDLEAAAELLSEYLLAAEDGISC